MKSKTLDTEIAFRDLTRANKKLRHQHKNPDALRRRFTDFVTLSQKLTAVMYKEYPALTSQKWKASIFTGWSPVTELFKALRNIDQHQYLIRITITQVQVFEGTGIKKDEEGNEIRTPMNFEVYMEFSSETGLKKKVPGRFGVGPLTVNGVEQSVGEPDNVYYTFHLEGLTSEIKEALKTAGTDNIHELAEQCYAVLVDYYEYYRSQLAANHTA